MRVTADAQGALPTRHLTLVALVAQARWVRSDEREAFAERCRPYAEDESVIIVHTCHRVEMYVAAEHYADRPLPSLPEGGIRLDDADAARHLITVASGMDSAVLGEDQILHQIKEALRARTEAGRLHPILSRLFQSALGAGKRAQEILGDQKRSLGDAALDEIASVGGPVDGRRVLVVGAGSMGRVAAVAARRRGAAVSVASRSDEHAAELAERVGVGFCPLDEVAALTARSEGLAGVIVAMSGRWEVGAEAVSSFVARGVPVVDLSSPIAVPAAARDALAERFTSIDDLAWGSGDVLSQELRNQVGTVIVTSGRDYCRWLVTRQAAPAVKAMSESAEAHRQAELQWLMRRMPAMSDTERALIEQMTHRLVSGILHTPKSAVREDESGQLAKALGELFHI